MLKMRKKVDKDNASLPIPNKRKEKENKASPPTLSLERGVICSPIVFYLLSISKVFYSPLLGEGPGERLPCPFYTRAV